MIRGALAFIGSWVAMCAIGELALQIQEFGYIMLFGVISYWISEAARRWIAPNQAHQEGK